MQTIPQTYRPAATVGTAGKTSAYYFTQNAQARHEFFHPARYVFGFSSGLLFEKLLGAGEDGVCRANGLTLGSPRITAVGHGSRAPTVEYRRGLDISKQDYDVLIVGSGASGSWAAKRLTETGLRVAILEAGRPQSDMNFREHEPAFNLPYRNLAREQILRTRPIQGTLSDCSEYIYDWFVNDLDEPYTTPTDKPTTGSDGCA